MKRDGKPIIFCENYKYVISDTDNAKVTLLGEMGNMDETIIPEEITHDNKTYKVISIDSGAFSCCTNLRSILIPNSITSIGTYAFRDCFNLRNIILPNSVISIGEYAFSGCRSLANIVIPNSVTSIGAHTFQDCLSLSDIKISDNLVSIDEYAFSGCQNLKKIILPEGCNLCSDVNSIFKDCKNLEEIQYKGHCCLKNKDGKWMVK